MKFRKKLKVISKIKLDSQPVCNEKHLKAKIKSYNGKIKINFHNSKIPKEGSPFIFLPVILIDSIFRTGKNYYPELFLECNCVLKKKRLLKILLTILKFPLIPIKKILTKKILISKIFRNLKRSTWKISKSFWRRNKIKGGKRLEKDIKMILKEKKTPLSSWM